MKDWVGSKGEEIAVRYLVEEGWEILDRNWREKLGEIDIVAARPQEWDGRTIQLLAFVEVKSAASAGPFPPELHVHGGKRKKLVKLAQLYILRNRLRGAMARFDVIAVELDPLVIRHYRNAFDASGRL